MPVITRIKQQKDKDRVNVYLDGKFSFGIDLDNFVKFNLRVEQVLTEEDIERIKTTADFQKILMKLLDFATRRPRSNKEIESWFFRKKVPEDYKSMLFEKLKYFNYSGDERFARWWVEQRLEFKSKSKRAITYELMQKGVKRELVEEIFSEFKVDDYEVAKKFMEKKSPRWEKLDALSRKKKIMTYLSGKGFSWDIVSKFLK